MENLVILLFIGAIGLVNWLIKKSGEVREQRQAEQAAQRGDMPETLGGEPTYSDTSTHTEEDPDAAMRKLMEALGLPVEERPAPVRQQAPPLVQTPKPKKQKRPKPLFTSPAPASIPAARQAAAISPAAMRKSPMADLLRKPGNLRQAILLREILGPCKAQ